MKLSEELLEALLAYGAIEKEVSTVGLRRGVEAKHELVRARRQLSEQIGRLGTLIERHEASSGGLDTQKDFGRLFTTMRYALAMHQASWPVVLIDENPEAYRQSARGVQSKSQAFWIWCRTHLDVENR